MNYEVGSMNERDQGHGVIPKNVKIGKGNAGRPQAGEVAQTSGLLYRRLPACRARNRETLSNLPIPNERNRLAPFPAPLGARQSSRPELCAT